MERFETWLSSKTSPDSEAWIRQLPPTPRITDILLHYPPSSKDRVDQIMRRILHLAAARPPPIHPHVRLNADGVCVLFFSDETTTSEVAEFLCCVATRMRSRCDRANPRPEDSDHDVGWNLSPSYIGRRHAGLRTRRRSRQSVRRRERAAANVWVASPTQNLIRSTRTARRAVQSSRGNSPAQRRRQLLCCCSPQYCN